MRPYRDHLIADTRRRLIAANDALMPEGESRMIAPVRRIMQAQTKNTFDLIPEKVYIWMIWYVSINVGIINYYRKCIFL